jgi:pyrroloquinoline quinone biosynthesis protein D
MLTLTKKVSLNDKFRLQWEPAQNCHVLLFSEGMVELNDSSVEIIKSCDGKKTGEEIIQEFEALYPEAEIREDLLTFFKEASQYGWLVNVD